MKTTRFMQVGIGAVLVSVVVGCNPVRISGTVVHVNGEALPGVAVTVEGTDYQALTNELGQYEVGFRPGRVILRFAKTGYTPGKAEVFVDAYESVPAEPVELWPLPSAPGVYLFDDYRYRSAEPIQPKAYNTLTSGLIHGTVRWTQVNTLEQEPLIICFSKKPRYGLTLCRLELADVLPAEAVDGSNTLGVWTQTRTVPMSPVAIDEQGTLLQLRLEHPLGPGCYAVHWGALDGKSRSDPRMFVFRVGETGVFKPLPENEPQTDPVTEPDA